MKFHRHIARAVVVLMTLAWLVSPGISVTHAQSDLPTWVDAQEKDGIAYFLYSAQTSTYPNSIRRYDLIARTWIADIPLPGSPTVFRVDDGLYVSFGPDVQRF